MCSDAGAIPQRVTNDENGWDYLVELSENKHEGPAEEQPAWKTFYVQVKSSHSKKPVADLTLSNALKMSQHDEPWFLVLFHYPNSGPKRVYVKHIWKDFISLSLKEIRAARIKNIKLNKKRITITFDSKDQYNDSTVLDWMEVSVESIGSNYRAIKKRIFESVGREYGRGHFRIASQSFEEVNRAFLGLNSLEVDEFEFKPLRFGIEDPEETIRFSSGKIQFGPKPREMGILKLRRCKSIDAITFVCAIYESPFGNHDGEVMRIDAPLCDILLRSDGSASFKISLDPSKSYSMEDYSKFAQINIWMTTDGIESEFQINGKKYLRGVIRSKANRTPWKIIADVADLWRNNDTAPQQLSPAAFQESLPQLVAFGRCVTESWIALEGTAPETNLLKTTELRYTCSATCGDRRIRATAARSVTLAAPSGTNTRLEFGEPNILELDVAPAVTAEELESEEATLRESIDNLDNVVIAMSEISSVLLSPRDDFYFYVNSP